MLADRRWLGIDFSGNFRQWGEHRRRSNVWVATVEDNGGLALMDLRRVQCLGGQGSPFDRLVSLLRRGEYRAAAIDAPFSFPCRYVPAGGHSELLENVSGIEHPGRPFPDGASLVLAVTGQNPPLDPPQPLRRTEQLWRHKGIAVRSTLWNGPRPGAPMTAACLKLLLGAGRPIWPWARSEEPALLVEGFPAAQLRQWNWPFTGYNRNQAVRKDIVRWLEQGQRVTIPEKTELVASADALDAVLCAFAAIAVTEERIAYRPERPAAGWEGWIAVSI